ncbi:hypothetical protein GCM10010191_22170 [Actinomadura vinacea]|uniref:Acyl-CoA dehydrogenase n=1 Tax=Actinomadura vinacea TaxID=115336 RepID=A0ABP5VUU0_9ACTN
MSPEEQVEPLTHRLLEEHPPAATDRAHFFAAQYDAGLTWVHHPVGHGGIGVERAAQRRVFELLTASGTPIL